MIQKRCLVHTCFTYFIHDQFVWLVTTIYIYIHIYRPYSSAYFTCCMLCLVAQLCPALCDPMDCSPPASFVYGDSPGKNTGVGCHAWRVVHSRGSSQPSDRSQVSCIAGGFFTIWAMREAHVSHTTILLSLANTIYKFCLHFINTLSYSYPSHFLVFHNRIKYSQIRRTHITHSLVNMYWTSTMY